MRHQARANLAGKSQFLVVEVTDQECIHTVVTRWSIPTDDKFLLALQLQLLPCARSLPAS